MTVSQLTVQEERILRLRAQGLTNEAVGIDLGLAEQTVRNHMSNAYRKLDVAGLIDAMHLLGWIAVPEGILERGRCGYVGRCGRPLGHTGHHGGFRAA